MHRIFKKIKTLIHSWYTHYAKRIHNTLEYCSKSVFGKLLILNQQNIEVYLYSADFIEHINAIIAANMVAIQTFAASQVVAKISKFHKKTSANADKSTNSI